MSLRTRGKDEPGAGRSSYDLSCVANTAQGIAQAIQDVEAFEARGVSYLEQLVGLGLPDYDEQAYGSKERYNAAVAAELEPFVEAMLDIGPEITREFGPRQALVFILGCGNNAGYAEIAQAAAARNRYMSILRLAQREDMTIEVASQHILREDYQHNTNRFNA